MYLRGYACWLLLCYVRCGYAQSTPRVVGTVFINDSKNRVLKTPLGGARNNVLDFARVETRNVNVRFITRRAESIRVTLDKPRISFCRRARPYQLFARNPRRSQTFAAGRRIFTATPYSEPRCTGRKGKTYRKTIWVSPGLGEVSSQGENVDAIFIPKVAGPSVAESTTTRAPRGDPLQPQITVIESRPANKVCGLIALPGGSPWCRGRPTVWAPGHKDKNDEPNCYNPANSSWARPGFAQFDDRDALNDIDGPDVIDRHDCAYLDINNDGILDIFCQVGANSGTGLGFNELYLTNRNGSLRKISRHGLQQHNGMRGRHLAVLKGPGNEQYIFTATKGTDVRERFDGKSNKHRMYRLTRRAPNYFSEVRGPFNIDTDATCAFTLDANNDGLDDLIMCNRKEFPSMFVQNSGGGSWRSVSMDYGRANTRNWRKIRTADVTGDGIPDLLVAFWGNKPDFKVFKGIRESPYFDLKRAYYAARLPNAIPDLEVVDVNRDGKLDIYIVQSDERKFEPNSNKLRTPMPYCAGPFVHKRWWRTGGNQPPRSFTPPRDRASDFVLLNVITSATASKRKNRSAFNQIRMRHAEPGCGSLVKPFGPGKLVLAQGDFVRPGHQLLLDWY